MRRSELTGLKWDCVDLEKGVIHVTRTRQRITGRGLVEGVPKTNKSKRSIDIGPDAPSLLNKIKTSQAVKRLAMGPVWSHTNYVFSKDDGNPIDPDAITHAFGTIVRQNSLPRLSFHGLRHAHATLLLTSGIHAKVVSERLGHSNISITMDTYSHVLPNLQKEAAIAIDNVLALTVAS